ncbi:MAG TPA: alpha-1,2-fucosyltransferase [Candidatus Gastranaerophilaceae bacterium]|nr:alpha-1,2-fucosyltransferase [Candidatus Gastranaerophilaceae bacterium]
MILKRCWGIFKLLINKQQPVAIIMVDGGLGSQLNKLIIGEILKKKTGALVKYDLSWFEDCGKSIDNKENRLFELTKVFKNIDFPIATEEEIKLYKKCFRHKNKNSFKYNKKDLSKKPPVYLDGYFGNWQYLAEFQILGLQKPEFNLELSTKNQEILNRISNSEISIAVHIRRGDYVNSIHEVLNANYFINAINYMKNSFDKPVKFFIFSNGMDWVKNEIIPNLNNADFELIEENNNDSGAYDFYLLTQCKHQIISNASFGFLGAFLNKNENKKVITPQVWIKKQKSDKLDFENSKAFHYKDWIVMSNEGEIIND